MKIAVQNDRQWQVLCAVLGLGSLADDERLTTNATRLRDREEVELAVSEAVATWSPGELAEALDREGVPWGRLNHTADVAHHPQLEAGRRWRPVDLPNGESISVLAPPFWFGGDAQRGTTPRVPGLGEHTREVVDDLTAHDGVRHG